MDDRIQRLLGRAVGAHEIPARERTDTDPDLLAFLAATLLEGMLPAKAGPPLDAVEAAILEDARFADLFFDIHFNGLKEPVVVRIVTAVTKVVEPRRVAV